jgi:betaine-aldehyde dehydrogenase
MVVFDDARGMLPALVDWIMLGIFFTTGQICSATSRVVVESSLHDELVSSMRAVPCRALCCVGNRDACQPPTVDGYRR